MSKTSQRRRQAQIKKIKDATSKFAPDAGLSSPNRNGDNYYWFQVGELIQTCCELEHLLVDDNQVLIPQQVDIMDAQGHQHLVPHRETGYMASLMFSKPALISLSEAILRSTAIRVTGTLGCVMTAPPPLNESHQLIHVTDVLIKDRPQNPDLVYMIPARGGMIRTTAGKISQQVLALTNKF